MNTNRELRELTSAWKAVQKFTHLRPIQNEDEFERIQELCNWLADEVRDDQSHPLCSMFDLAMQLLEDWESEHVVVPDVAPREVLRHLLQVNNLKQKDLGDIASHTLISDILSGRREISKRLAKALAGRFNVDVSAFV